MGQQVRCDASWAFRGDNFIWYANNLERLIEQQKRQQEGKARPRPPTEPPREMMRSSPSSVPLRAPERKQKPSWPGEELKGVVTTYAGPNKNQTQQRFAFMYCGHEAEAVIRRGEMIKFVLGFPGKGDFDRRCAPVTFYIWRLRHRWFFFQGWATPSGGTSP